VAVLGLLLGLGLGSAPLSSATWQRRESWASLLGLGSSRHHMAMVTRTRSCVQHWRRACETGSGHASLHPSRRRNGGSLEVAVVAAAAGV
jgi:hypothetical protein